MSDDVKTLSRDESLRQAFYDHLLSAYNNFSTTINRIPYHPEIKKIIIQYIDTGFLWAQEGLKTVNLQSVDNVKELKPNTDNHAA